MLKLSAEFYKRIVSGLCLLGLITLFKQYLIAFFMVFYIVMFYELYQSISNAIVFSSLEKKVVIWYFGLYFLMSFLSLLEIQCLCYFILSLFALDSVSFMVGKIIGGPVLFPKISPNKTVAGYVIGLFIGSFAFYWLVYEAFVPSVCWNVGLSFGTALSADIGDLILSYFKRLLGIKDFSNFLPGHGGFLDRFDGLLLSSIFYYILLKSCNY